MAEAIPRSYSSIEKDEVINETPGTNIDPEAEKKLLRKCDLRVLPPLFVIFLLAFLDRTNIGNAKIQGLTRDLHMEGPNSVRYNIALFIFFVPYVLFEVPSNLILKKLAPSTWLSLIMVLWAYVLAKMDGLANYGGWRWIFIIEGAATVVVGLLTKFWLVDWPETASFLNDAERSLLLARLSSDTGDASMDRLDKRAAKRIVRDPKMYLGSLAYFGVVTCSNSGSFFIPTIIHELGYKASDAQVRTIPIYIVAFVVALALAWLTDRLQHRYWFCMTGVVIATVGYIMLLAQNNLSIGVKYFALFLIIPGQFVTQPIVLVWLSNLMSGHYKRSVSSAVQVSFGNLGGIIASNIFIGPEAPKYPTGYGTCLGMLGICAVACTSLFWLVKSENKKRERGERDWRLQEPDADNLGDDHPAFRLTT
ncbi:hypothetical protein SNOG_15731 [Parastagonospora nodorum SN15]|uniref:Major facilitator superfamily (MFS) profile domain-containing protein n=1 Tax=Phaeosphaeria nodorum (strain SN15 / ATCC MYA-4574 / FGSC 10173) TaxID=321614 RepID=Q0TXG6_PHANO|nr:hypothetical protein SNOG_15731 [Parastagonospora nodorum SN15]EAT76826.2 hypothetical protein SNOG_15731 [Parastagonospora nodorum SN15]